MMPIHAKILLKAILLKSIKKAMHFCWNKSNGIYRQATDKAKTTRSKHMQWHFAEKYNSVLPSQIEDSVVVLIIFNLISSLYVCCIYVFDE